jgi:tetratricopeptide (TPR) repeat protein
LQDLDFFHQLKYSNAYLLTFYDLMHYDFSCSHILSEIHAFAEGSGRDSERIDLGYAVACRYVLAFFQAYVNGDQEALAFLERPPEANQLPADVLTIDRKKAVAAPPSREQFFGHIHAGQIQQAVNLFHRAREVDPDATLFTEELLSPLAHELLNRGLTEEAIKVYQLQVTAYPGSWSAHAALGDAYLEQGSRGLAVESYRKSLDLNPENDAARAVVDAADTGVTPAR